MEVYARYCHKKVEKMTMTGAKKGLKKPTTEEILQAKVRGPIHIYIIMMSYMCKKQHTRRYELYTMGTSLPTVSQNRHL